jgi:hypothetical protein
MQHQISVGDDADRPHDPVATRLDHHEIADLEVCHPPRRVHDRFVALRRDDLTNT